MASFRCLWPAKSANGLLSERVGLLFSAGRPPNRAPLLALTSGAAVGPVAGGAAAAAATDEHPRAPNNQLAAATCPNIDRPDGLQARWTARRRAGERARWRPAGRGQCNLLALAAGNKLMQIERSNRKNNHVKLIISPHPRSCLQIQLHSDATSDANMRPAQPAKPQQGTTNDGDAAIGR